MEKLTSHTGGHTLDEADSVWDAGDVTDNGDDDNGAGDGTEKLMLGDIIVEEKKPNQQG